MCSPFLPKQKSESYFIGRIISYSLMGGALGGVGGLFIERLEYKAVAFFAFILFAALTAVLIGYTQIIESFFPRVKIKGGGAFLRGLLSAWIPCHLLYFFYALAVLSGTALGGGVILFAHAVVSMPALAYGGHALKKLDLILPHQITKKFLKMLILCICVLNLLYFGSRVFYEDQEAKDKILFCF
jgi:sulfite exporter TauE/SafE